jgi:hypothetical protein
MEIRHILEKRVDYSDEPDNYKSRFNFEEFEITEQDIISELIQKEEKILKNIKLFQRQSFEFSKTLYETRELLANHKTGVFVAWFENIGLKKNTVYRAIDKYEIYLNCRDQKVLELPREVINTIKKSELHRNEILEVINSDNIRETLKEKIENKKDILINEINIDREIVKINKQIQKYYGKIAELEKKKTEFSQSCENLEKEIN